MIKISKNKERKMTLENISNDTKIKSNSDHEYPIIFENILNFVPKPKKISVAQYIIKNFPKYQWIINKNLKKNIKKHASIRPNIRTELNDRIIVIEVDEQQHKAYDKSKEQSRIFEFSNNIDQKNVYIIRFNPDEYKFNDEDIPSCWAINNKNNVILLIILAGIRDFLYCRKLSICVLHTRQLILLK